MKNLFLLLVPFAMITRQTEGKVNSKYVQCHAADWQQEQKDLFWVIHLSLTVLAFCKFMIIIIYIYN